MTPIQAQSLPLILLGKDILGQAKTGSGKTAAFGLGVLNQLDVGQYHIQSIIVCPTRELAEQVASEIRKLARSVANIKILCICGGVAFAPQAKSLERGAHIVVGTPGRLIDHIDKNTIALNQVKVVVLDEADRMLDMGFIESLNAIIGQTPKQRQTLLFSATFPNQVHCIAKSITREAQHVQVDQEVVNDDIKQFFYRVEPKNRVNSIRLLLMEHAPESSLIFCNTKLETQDVATQLSQFGFDVLALHGDLEQRERDLVLVRFANKSVSILVATDVAARGLDINNVEGVFNFQIARDLDMHIHRVGRTGRAGVTGQAFTLYSENESYKLNMLATHLNRKISTSALPPKTVQNKLIQRAAMITIQINGGKKQKMRPGDILGALTGPGGIKGEDVGKIHITSFSSFVAVRRGAISVALAKLNNEKIKGRKFKIRSL